jgi:hypothetical protein
MIDMAVQDESVDSVRLCNDLVSQGIGGRLLAFAIGAVGTVESLLRQDHTSRLALPQHLLLR